MDANDANKNRIIHKELSYKVNGLLFEVHNKLGRFCREKQYGDAFETLLKQETIIFEREKDLPIEIIDDQQTNKVDFIIGNTLLVDLKTKDCITKEDYRQMQRYLEASKKKLGILVNFRSRYLHPIRVIRINS